MDNSFIEQEKQLAIKQARINALQQTIEDIEYKYKNLEDAEAYLKNDLANLSENIEKIQIENNLLKEIIYQLYSRR